MTVLPALPSATRPRQTWLRSLAIASLCLGAAALPTLMQAFQPTGLQPLAPTLEGLAEAPMLRLPVSLPTGTQITPPLGEGSSQLTVKNGNPVDAVFKLVDRASGQTLRFVYVQANQEVTLDDLASCSCDLRFATGLDWDASQQRFLRSAAFFAFSDPMDFVVEPEGDHLYWTTYEVTLHRILGGNAATETLDEDAF
jgi:hypothetical protein